MSKNEKYLTCFYLMQSKFRLEQEKEHALNSKNISVIKDLTNQVSQLDERLNKEFIPEFEAIQSEIKKDGYKISGLNEIWLIEKFNK